MWFDSLPAKESNVPSARTTAVQGVTSGATVRALRRQLREARNDRRKSVNRVNLRRAQILSAPAPRSVGRVACDARIDHRNADVEPAVDPVSLVRFNHVLLTKAAVAQFEEMMGHKEAA